MRPIWKSRSASGNGETPRYWPRLCAYRPFCGVDFSPLGMQADHGRETFKARSELCRFLAQGKGFIVAAESLKDCRTLAIGGFRIQREPLGTIEVAQGIVKPVEAGARSRACDPSRCVAGRVAYKLLRDLLCPLVIGNAPKDQPAQGDQLDETYSNFHGGATNPDLRFEGVNLRAKILQSNRAVG